VRLLSGSLVALLVLAASAAPAVAQTPDCSEPESAWTMDTLRDWVSFSDQLSVIEVLGHKIPPTPDGPEGWAGLISRRVKVRVERTLWRRPTAARAPAEFSFIDWGWWGELDDRRPIHMCGTARLRVGQRYLAMITRYRGPWFAVDAGRLLLRGRRVVGGVDGEPSAAQHELTGRTVAQAARLVRGTGPYRAAARHPELNPARRWGKVESDRYRSTPADRFAPIPVTAGVTSLSRWTLYTRRGRRGGWCLGISMRPLWPGGGPAPSGEGCGAPFSADREITLGLAGAAGRGTFAYGRAWRDIYSVRVTSGGRPPATVETTFAPNEVGGPERYWVLPLEGDCSSIAAEAIDRQGRTVERIQIGDPLTAC
jgi:hypothetical protein